MFSRAQKTSARGEEEKLLGRTSHELTIRSAASPTATASLLPPSQATSPLTASVRHSYYLKGNMPTTVPAKPVGSTTSVMDPPGFNSPADSRPTTINDPFTGEPKAILVPDYPGALGSPFSVFEDCTTDSATQEKFWTHVQKIRELQSEVARMHIAMESIGKQPEPQPVKEKEKEKDKPRKFRGQTTGGRSGVNAAMNTDREETGHSASDTDHAGSGRDSRSGAKTNDLAVSGVATDTGEHFAERKEAIQNIMKKLSELSQQVSGFHQLPTPEITFPVSPSRQTQPSSPPQTPPQSSTLSVPSPTHPSLVPRPKTGHIPRQSPLGLNGQAPPRLIIPKPPVSLLGNQTQPATPSKVKPHSIISNDGTFHESPASIPPGHTP